MKALEKFGEKIGELEVRHPKKFLWAIFLVTLLMIPGLFQMKIEPSLEKVLPQDLDVLKDMNYMRDQFGADMIYIVYDVSDSGFSSVLDPKVLKQVEITEKYIEREKNILMVNSFPKMIRDYNNVFYQKIEKK